MYFPIIDALKESFIAKIPSIVTKWLTDNVNPVGSAVVVDESLSISGAAADAKKTGDELIDLKSDFSVDSDIINKNIFGLNIQENLYDGGLDFSGDWTKINVASSALQDETYLGFPVMKITSTWARFYKVFPVESGKTYTFEAWFNADNTSSVFLYLVAPDTENAATLSTGNRIQYNNQFEANKWNKISVTFTASTAGNISPYIAVSSGTGIKISRLVVVEGTSVFDLSEALIDVQNIPKIYHVEKDGSGDFDSLVAAIAEAIKYKDSVVYVGDGTWDIVEELGSSYISSVDTTHRGVYLQNGIHIIFSNKALIICEYDGTNSNVITWLSAFNAGVGGFTIENAHIKTKNVRYAIHDERGQDSDFYINTYKNCIIEHDNTQVSGATAQGFPQCIGGGLGLNGYINIENCVFSNANSSASGTLVSYHNSEGNGLSNICIRDNYFKGNGRVKITWYGSSTEKTPVIVTNNSFGQPIVFQAETSSATNENMELIAWNNEIRA